jgi:hypothetical protein
MSQRIDERASRGTAAGSGPNSPYVALGLAVDHLMTKPAFSGLRFGEWSRILVVFVLVFTPVAAGCCKPATRKNDESICLSAQES